MNIKALKLLCMISCILGLIIIILSLFSGTIEWLFVFTGSLLVFLGLANFYLFSKRT
ncbi:MAG: hypothetical protein FWH54_00100 [Methanobrevibacter sp.]|nr:hypothetical protein [Methanobrevibacter sp.]